MGNHQPASAEPPVAGSDRDHRSAAIDAAIAEHLRKLRECGAREDKAISAGRDAGYQTLAAAYEARVLLGNDEATIRAWLQAAAIEATKALVRNPALAVVKAAYGVADNKRASDAAAVLNGLEAKEVPVEMALGFLREHGSVAVAAMGRKPKEGAEEAKAQKQKLAALKLAASRLGTATGITLPVAPAENGYVVLIAKPDDDGGLQVHGATNDEGAVDRIMELAAKHVRL
ncbi:MAG: hypothetical protein ACOCYE_04950 [Pseudomonadota bacterium]